MSSSRLLVFTPRIANIEWAAGTHTLTLIIRQTDRGYLGFLQTWSVATRTYSVHSVPFDQPETFFATKEEAEAACQIRYEQELRWSHTRGE